MLYCTTLDWTDERFESDWKAYQQYLRDSIELLCSHYGPIGGFWFEGNWSKKDADWEGGITRVPALAQALGQGQAQEMGGLHQRPEGQGVQTATFHGSPQQAVEPQGRASRRAR